ncbi:hypothetical protein [Pseudoscardovia radai]|uniref:hypothetical protein n=1 Tax=Pseudoscardovia radai TaxID=987066 RepID=UPI0039964A09
MLWADDFLAEMGLGGCCGTRLTRFGVFFDDFSVEMAFGGCGEGGDIVFSAKNTTVWDKTRENEKKRPATQ